MKMRFHANQAASSGDKQLLLSRRVKARNIIIPVLIALVLFFVSEKNLWRWSWEQGNHAQYNYRPVTDARGNSVEAWRWVEGKEIRIYTSPAINDKHVRFAAAGVRDLISDLGLGITVKVTPPPARVIQALAHSRIKTGKTCWVDYQRLSRELIVTRNGHFAEIVYAPDMIDQSEDVTGVAEFSTGVAILNAKTATACTARHETGHLLGYHMHDTWPVVIFGYAIPPFAKYDTTNGKDTLMMPDCDGEMLSDRSRDAILCFWRGLEKRTGNTYFDRRQYWCSARE